MRDACTWAGISLGKGPLWLLASFQIQKLFWPWSWALRETPAQSLRHRDVLAAEGLKNCFLESRPGPAQSQALLIHPWQPECTNTTGALWGFKSFTQDYRWGSCCKNLPPCHSLIHWRRYHPDFQFSASGSRSHLMIVSLSLDIHHHLSTINIWFLLCIQTQTCTHPCTMISEHLLTFPDKNITSGNSKDVMSK